MTNILSYTKMHGLGNDFMMVNALHEPRLFSESLIQKLGDRHLGVGFDQLLVIEPSKQADVYCRIYNQDGSEAEFCGNGLRCVAWYLKELNHIKHHALSIETKAGIFKAHIENADHISIILPPPIIQHASIQLGAYTLCELSLGNPHAILRVDRLNQQPISSIASEIATHSHFPQGVNVGFLEIVSRSLAKLRTVERGVGETAACGSNTCAAAVAGILRGWLDNAVDILLLHGKLHIEWAGEGKPITMTGPAAYVYEGTLNTDLFK